MDKVQKPSASEETFMETSRGGEYLADVSVDGMVTVWKWLILYIIQMSTELNWLRKDSKDGIL
jgi:hypothetical protein